MAESRVARIPHACTRRQPHCSGFTAGEVRIQLARLASAPSLRNPTASATIPGSDPLLCCASQLNIDTGAGGAFSQFVSLAINSTAGPVAAFNPYADNLHFLIGAYIIEDVVPTAWEARQLPLQQPGLHCVTAKRSRLVRSAPRLVAASLL